MRQFLGHQISLGFRVTCSLVFFLLFQLKVVRGPIGTSSLKFMLHNYGSRTISLDDPRPGVVVPAHSLRSLNATFDTLAIDCDWVLVEEVSDELPHS